MSYEKLCGTFLLKQKRVHNKEKIPSLKILPLADIPPLYQNWLRSLKKKLRKGLTI